jgi:charged multivesicular body protein 3
MNIFGTSTSKTTEELVKEWKRKLAKEIRNLDREIDKLKKEEQKSLKECKKLAKEGHINSAKILAKEIVGVRKACDRMYATKAQLNSVTMNLQTAAAMSKVKGCISKSAAIMTSMNS